MRPVSRSQDTHHRNRRLSGRAQQNAIADSYQPAGKLMEPTVCKTCGAVYHRGRWQWKTGRAEGVQGTCPACRRIADNLPAGVVTIHCAPPHIAEITALARHQEQAESREHPLNRIMSIETTENGLVVNTTDIHLPRRIGEALERAFHGRLEMNFDETGYFARVDWHEPE